MNTFKQLILKGEKRLVGEMLVHERMNPGNVFRLGARWMHRMLGKEEDAFNDKVRYGMYGLLKYGIATFLMLSSAYLLFQVHPGLLPFCLFFFFLGEVHFLFMFPLLIEGKDHPLRRSVRLTYRMGLFSSMWTLFLIAAYMMVGLLDFKKPLWKWYVGCMAIIEWYKGEG